MSIPFLDIHLGKYLKAADNGDLFRHPLYLFYLVIGWSFVLTPLAVLFKGGSEVLRALDSDYETAGIKVLTVLAFLIALAVSLVIAYLAVVFWRDRAMRMRNITQMQSDFFVLPVWVHLIRSMGEWLGLVIAIALTTAGVIVFLFGLHGAFTSDYYQLETLGYALLALVGLPVLGVLSGYLVVFLHRIFAEGINVFLSMATNLSAIRSDTRNIANRR